MRERISEAVQGLVECLDLPGAAIGRTQQGRGALPAVAQPPHLVVGDLALVAHAQIPSRADRRELVLRLSVDQEVLVVTELLSVCSQGPCWSQQLSICLQVFVCRLVVLSLLIFLVIAAQLG